jgi:hypothetical protein
VFTGRSEGLFHIEIAEFRPFIHREVRRSERTKAIELIYALDARILFDLLIFL